MLALHLRAWATRRRHFVCICTSYGFGCAAPVRSCLTSGLWLGIAPALWLWRVPAQCFNSSHVAARLSYRWARRSERPCRKPSVDAVPCCSGSVAGECVLCGALRPPKTHGTAAAPARAGARNGQHSQRRGFQYRIEKANVDAKYRRAGNPTPPKLHKTRTAQEGAVRSAPPQVPSVVLRRQHRQLRKTAQSRHTHGQNVLQITCGAVRRHQGH